MEPNLTEPDTRNTFSSKKIALIILIIIFGFVLYLMRDKISFNASNNTITDLPAGTISPSFPQDIILVDDAVILSSYTGKTADGKNQSTLIYSSATNRNDVMKLYLPYLSKNGWAVKNKVTTTDLASLSKLVEQDNIESFNGTSRLNIVVKGEPSTQEAPKTMVIINLIQ
jgi:hypothetical protein